MKTKVICLIGASGSGKTTVAKELENKGYNVIKSYTTRKPREKGEWGNTFIKFPYIHEEGGDISYIQDLETTQRYYRKDMIAYFNNYKNIYFATEEQIKEGVDNIYIVDPIGAREVKAHFCHREDIKVITIYLESTEKTRQRRLEGRAGTNVEYRLKKDRTIFKDVEYDYEVDANKMVKEVVEQIERVLE